MTRHRLLLRTLSCGVIAVTSLAALSRGDVALAEHGHTQHLNWAGHSSKDVVRRDTGPGPVDLRGTKLLRRPDSDLQAVSALAPDSAWAVGNRNELSGDRSPRARHWDGLRWRTTPTHVGLGYAALADVVSVADADTWAVGDDRGETLTEHWDGTAWTRVDSPTHTGKWWDTHLEGVDAVSASDVWAVGYAKQIVKGVGTPYALHWNGRAWTVVAIAAPKDATYSLISISAISRNDVWALGEDFIEHWDGSSWSIVQRPAFNGMSAISASSAHDVWVVGQSWLDGRNQLMLEHWDGRSWSFVASPRLPRSAYAGDVSAVSADDAWVVGGLDKPVQGVRYLIEHWNGHSWSVVSAPKKHQNDSSVLVSVSGDAPQDAWALGRTGTVRFRTQLIHWDGHSWSPVRRPAPGPSAP